MKFRWQQESHLNQIGALRAESSFLEARLDARDRAVRRAGLNWRRTDDGELEIVYRGIAVNDVLLEAAFEEGEDAR
jgi:hypothetical protein